MDAPQPLSPPPSALDRVLGSMFLAAWRMAGLCVLPWVLLHPRATRKRCLIDRFRCHHTLRLRVFRIL